MASYFYKTKKIILSLSDNYKIIKNSDEIYTTLSIINNSEQEIKVIEYDGVNLDHEFGTILGSKKALTYNHPPKNSIYLYTESTDDIVILVKYSE